MPEEWQQTRLDHRARQAQGIAGAALSLILEHGAPALTMAALADAAGVSRQTLYRYFPDIDAVLVGMAELVASHDDLFEAQVREEPDPTAQLDVLVATSAQAHGHGALPATTLRASLPPPARAVLDDHARRVERLAQEVLQAGVRSGAFRPDLEPSVDAPLVLGLAAAADPGCIERALVLVHRLVDPEHEEHSR